MPRPGAPDEEHPRLEIAPTLAADVALLSAALDDRAADPVPDVAGAARTFVADARAVVASFVGLIVTVTVPGALVWGS